ncbi:hypothetical protein FEZ32_11405 [Acidipropionibacterium jensenii]|uniref:hypothetical protein n=1 Tax=Acidipropionibacterium jensenii TaxID=1749 RepID=UPI00110A4F05|nr:hypothetical protein [Acidipropionibacterium jensenii]QCV88874.1 hypothetical protein FEZ32_11405 [Acidipropionibacterium jensenii]
MHKPSRQIPLRDPHGPEAHGVASDRQSRMGWEHALATACPKHHAKPGEPCWRFHNAEGADRSGLCGQRCHDAGLIPPAPRPDRRRGPVEHPVAGPGEHRDALPSKGRPRPDLERRLADLHRVDR